MLYQIGTKFRDEIRPKLGIIRSKEFLMKDLYSFDRDQTSAITTYNKVCQAYEKIFKHIGVKFIKGRDNNIIHKIMQTANVINLVLVEGASGMMGGN